MAPILDIFKMNYTGELRWLESVKDIEDAKARLEVLGIATPGKYIVFDLTGYGLIFEIDLNGRLLEVDGDCGS
jgi:hypothetical protein